MNTKQALQALINDEKITLEGWDPEEYITLDLDGDLVNETGDIVSMAFESDDVWEIFEEPNPHTVGTFAWARYEAVNRGKIVRVTTPQGNAVADASGFSPGAFFTVSQFDATSWEIQVPV